MSVDVLPDSSKKISELPELKEVPDSAYLVFERGSSSYKISFSDFKNYVFSNISSELSLGTMAYKDSTEYSKFAHSHSYSDFWFFPSYGPQSNNP